MEKKSRKQHKYNVGDTVTVKIAAVHEKNGKTLYRLRGMENVAVSEKALDKMRQDRFRAGEMVYTVNLSEEEGVVVLEALVAEDVGSKEIKFADDWFEIEKDGMFSEQQEAEERAVELAEKYGCRIIRNGKREK